MTKRVVLAFSGGLDTSFCVVYLKEQGYEVITVAVDTGGFSHEQLRQIEQRALSLGAIEHFSIDAREKIYEQIIQYLIKLNGLYENDYPVMCADRYVIAEETIRIAREKQANFIAHGSTAMGNDQVRFDATFLTLASDLLIITPIKELGISRAKEIQFLEERGFEVDKRVKQYTINENVFGITASGGEIDEGTEPAPQAYQLTKLDPILTIHDQEYLTIEFKNGLPIAVNQQEQSGLALLQTLNERVGRWGFGSRIYTGDCIIGIKGRILFEAPGLFTLIEAHRKLEQQILTKAEFSFNEIARHQWADLVYGGRYYEPLVKHLERYADSAQQRVNGVVTIKLMPRQLAIVSTASANSMIRPDIAVYAQQSSWDATQANGFIKLYTMQQVLANR